MTTTSRYAQTFGEKPKAAQDFTILKDKPFTKLPSSQILKPEISQMLSKWLTLNDQDKLTGRIFFTVRDMYTCVKNQLAEVPTSQEHHASHTELKVCHPRFDKVLHSIHADRVRRNNNHSETKMVPNASRRVKSYFAPTLTDFKVGSKHRDFTPAKLGMLNKTIEGSPMVDTRGVKQ